MTTMTIKQAINRVDDLKSKTLDAAIDAARAQPPAVVKPLTVTPRHQTFKLGDRVRKTKGSEWEGHVVGFYSTDLTPEGYAVESSAHAGSVQIYPAAALERVAGAHGIGIKKEDGNA